VIQVKTLIMKLYDDIQNSAISTKPEFFLFCTVDNIVLLRGTTGIRLIVDLLVCYLLQER